MRHDWGTNGQESGWRGQEMGRSRDSERSMGGRDLERGMYGGERGWGPRELERGGWGMREDGERGMRRRMRGEDELSLQGEAPLVKVIEVVAQSPHSWEDATRRALAEASRTIDDIKSVYIKDMQAIVSNNRVVEFRLVAKISFAIRPERSHRGPMRRDYA